MAVLTLRGVPKDITIVCAYAPINDAAAPAKDAFYEALADRMERINNKTMVFVCGDFNAKLGHVDDAERVAIGPYTCGNRCDNGDRLVEFALAHRLFATNTGFKRLPHELVTWKADSNRARNQIDYILVQKWWRSSVRNVRTRWKELELSSDHAMLVARVRLKLKVDRTPKAQPRLDDNLLKVEAIKGQFCQGVAANLTGDLGGGVQEIWEKFRDAVLSSAHQVLKLGRRKVKHWFSTATIELLAQREEGRRAKIPRTLVRELTLKIRDSIRLDRETKLLLDAEAMEEASSRGDLAKLFKFVRGKSVAISETIKDDQGNVVRPENRKEAWRSYFDGLLNRAPPVSPVDDPDFTGFIPELKEDDVTQEEVEKAIRAMKSGKAPGENGITANMLKALGLIAVEPLTKLLQLAYRRKEIPEEWCSATIIPLFKKGDRTRCGNYRGISLLDVCLKVYEKVLLNRIGLTIDPYMRETQAGFRPGRGCVDQIFTLRHLLQHRHEFRRKTLVCFVDFSAAFDSIHRDSMYQIMDAIGIGRPLVRAIMSLYRRTTSKVKVYEECTDDFDIVSGVRQGSILSPLLFIIVICWVLDKALENQEGITVFPAERKVLDLAFADDIALLAESEEALQQMVDSVESVAATVGLKINVGKTKVLACCCDAPPAITLGGDTLEVVESFKYLGSDTDGKGSATGDIRRRIAMAVGTFNALSERVWKQPVAVGIKKRIYDACIRSILLYGCETWQMLEEDIRRLESCEMRFWRRILGIRYFDRITNEEVMSRFLHPIPTRAAIVHRQLSWFGHALRRNDDRLIKQVIFNEKGPGWKRPQGGTFKTWERHVKKTLEPMLHPPGAGLQWRNWAADCLEVATSKERWKGLVRDTIHRDTHNDE